MSDTMPSGGEEALSAGHFDQPGAGQDRSAGALQWQHMQLGLTARGSTLGIGRRTVPSASYQFSSPPVSKDQFGGGGGENARSPLDDSIG